MKFNYNYALYYPTIEFVDHDWLWVAALLWDRIYRIVPMDYVPDDADNVKKIMEDGEIGIFLHPDTYASDIADEFMEKVRTKRWDAAALVGSMDKGYRAIHKGKVDVRLREMIIETGKGKASGDWLNVPTEFAALYMTYLVKHMSEINNLSVVSEMPSAWTGATYFKYDGFVEDYPREELPYVLAALVIKDFCPINISDLRPEDMIKFRRLYKDERRNFVGSMQLAAKKMANCKDSKIAGDMYRDITKDINSALKDYKKSMEILNVEGWTGLKTISFPVSTGVVGKLIGLDVTQLSIATGTGIALGVISGLAKLKRQKERLSRESDFSYLVHINNQWEKCYSSHDYNYYLCREMEEFIND